MAQDIGVVIGALWMAFCAYMLVMAIYRDSLSGNFEWFNGCLVPALAVVGGLYIIFEIF